MKNITVERVINVPQEKVWAKASKFLESPGPSISVVVEKKGDKNGVGSERTISFKNSKVSERLESIDPPNYFTYKILSGAPVKSYLGRAEFKPKGNTTVIKWSGAFTPKVPGTAWIIGIVAKRNINQFIDELENIK